MTTSNPPTCKHCQAPLTLLDNWLAVGGQLAHNECHRKAQDATPTRSYRVQAA